MDDLHQDSQTGLPMEYSALCSEYFEASVSAEVCLLEHQWISRGFTLTRYLGKGYVSSVSEKQKDSLDIDHPRKDGGLQIDFSQETFFGCFFGTLP